MKECKHNHECEQDFIKVLKKNICELNCECGWNITIGGTKIEDLQEIERIVSVLCKKETPSH